MLTAQRQRELSSQISSTTNKNKMDSITIGVVADTNDPQQMGRVRAICARWGDSSQANLDAIPWAVYSAPFAGHTQVGTRGNGIQTSTGGIAYGMWAIPKVGAQVLVMCIDSDPNQRVYVGCLFDQYTPHTLPHGRFMYDDHPVLDNTITPSGPYTSAEKPIEPLYTNIRQAFGNKKNRNYEWENRAADCTATALDVESLANTFSQVADDKDISKNDWTSRQGYQTNRQTPTLQTSEHTPRNLDSMVYSFTSPGFHSLSMDDRMENCRVRLRTTSGHQIIMDDTNERIYIATAKGENWIEMDQTGNIDVFSSNKLNIRTAQGINLTSDGDIRIQSGKAIHMIAADNIHLQTTKELHVKTGGTLNLTSGAQMNYASGGDIIMSASPNIHFNGPAATQAEKAKWTSRVPAHEPWGRITTKDDYTHEPELPYDSKEMNKQERGNPITRGLYWRR